MALQEYEIISEINKSTKTWVDVNKKLIITRQLPKHCYCCFAKKYNPQYNDYDYYLIAGNNIFSLDNNYQLTYYDMYGKTKLKIPTIMYNDFIKNKIYNFVISLDAVETNEDYIVYKIGF